MNVRDNICTPIAPLDLRSQSTYRYWIPIWFDLISHAWKNRHREVTKQVIDRSRGRILEALWPQTHSASSHFPLPLSMWPDGAPRIRASADGSLVGFISETCVYAALVLRYWTSLTLTLLIPQGIAKDKSFKTNGPTCKKTAHSREAFDCREFSSRSSGQTQQNVITLVIRSTYTHRQTGKLKQL